MTPRAAKSAAEETVDAASVPPVVEEFLRHLAKERDVSPNTVLAYQRDLVAFVGRYGFSPFGRTAGPR